jgi:ribose transport system permease protein
MHKPLGDKVDIGLTQPNRWTAHSLGRTLLGLFRAKEMSVLLAVILVGGGIAMVTPYFLTTDNLMGVFRSFSLTAIMSIGMVMVIITGGIDLSVGSVMGLSGLVTALAFENGFSTAVSVSCGLGVGFLFGLTNGLLVTVGRLPPFIATLGTLSIGRGLMYIVTKGVPATPETPEMFSVIGQGYIGSVPAPVIIMLVLAVVFSVIMKFTTFGRHVYATGGNEQAAWLSGVNTSRVKLVVYTLSGTISALAGIVAFSRYLSAEPASGFGVELDVIAAAAIGGASLAGGVGSVMGAILGAALTGIIANGVVLMNINTYAQQAITGAVILIAVSIDVWRNARKER